MKTNNVYVKTRLGYWAKMIYELLTPKKWKVRNQNNRCGYGQLAYNHVKKKGGMLCEEKSQCGLNL